MSKEELYKLLNDRFEGWELVEILEITAEDICRAFEDEVHDNLEELKDLLGIDEIEEDDESTDYDETD